MFSLLWIVVMVVYCMECVLALSLNSCIVLVNGKSLYNGTKKNPSSVIQLIMGLINITLRGLLFIQFTAMSFPNFRFEGIYQVASIFLPFQMYFSSWLISWLCAYYCIRIVHFTHQVFIWVRRTLSSWLPWGLVLSGVGSIALGIVNIWAVKMATMYYNSTLLVTSYMEAKPLSLAFTAMSIFLGFCLPFIISSVSLLTTAVSLFRHIWNMKHQDSGFSPAQVQVHVNAIRTMILLLLLDVFFCISEMTVYYLMSVICWIVVTVFPTLEAAIIIQSSPTLSKVVLGRLCTGRAVETDR
ncbi:taste receptor type 2 member 40-like [Rana temporaria]|uniref:taste receptor type 2 member 40-like n=1 Tax=Rana temporaria TaxID=8407 RepID=UPI001AAC8E60|nr:taste receptor type 2 member 40-like [Rana temporaria]